MRRETNIQNVIIALLAITVVVMSIGYAVYSTQLNINGQATFSRAKWDVHFDTETFSETSTIKASTKTVTDNTITYAVTLPKPGFTVNSKNFGTIDANLTAITLSGLDAAQQNYITYTVSYNGTSYTSSASNLSVALAAGASHPVVVTVSYVAPESAANLPSTDQTVNMTVALDYQSAE